MTRAVMTGLAIIVLAGTMNVGVAWCCCLWAPLGATSQRRAYGASEMSEVWGAAAPERLLDTRRSDFAGAFLCFGFRERRGSGVCWLDVCALNLKGRYCDGLVVQAGWPLRCLEARTRGGDVYRANARWESAAALSFGRSVQAVFPVLYPDQFCRTPVIPLAPRLGPLLIDWLVYALVLAGVVIGPGLLRRWWRVRHGWCVACGYAVGRLVTCPECGDTRSLATRR